MSLGDVAAEAKRSSEMVGTMGVALSACTLPGQIISDRVSPGFMEFGLGIHGEPGAAVKELQSVDVVVPHILKQILSVETQFLPIKSGSRVVLMVNGLGATSLMELMIASGKAAPELQVIHGLAVDRIYTGSFMTSLDMSGLSITLMKADQDILRHLDAPTTAPYWPVGAEGDRPPAKIPIPMPRSRSSRNVEAVGRPLELNEQGCILEAAIEGAANEIINVRDQLNKWDRALGDGNYGSTMSRSATVILEDMKKCYPLNDAAETVNEIGASILRVMGRKSGLLYEIFCKAAYLKLKETPLITSKQWADALDASIAAVSKYSGAVPGYRTMIDALVPAATVLKERLDAGDDPFNAFLQSSEAAVTGAEMTVQMTAGRPGIARPDVFASVPDPGAMAASTWYRAAALAVKNKQQEGSKN